MKKWTAYLWLGLYSVLTLGIQINLHSCSDQLKTVGLWKQADCCHHDTDAHTGHDHAQCGDQSDEKCCSDQIFEISIDEEHVSSKTWKVEAALLHSDISQANSQNFNWAEIDQNTQETRAGPPLVMSVKRYERFQQRIIYG